MVPGSQMTMNGTGPSDSEKSDLTKWRDRAKTGKADRRRYEPTWWLCQSFLAGRQWVGWNPRTRRVVEIQNPNDRERHTTNVIAQYHQTVLGKLYVEDLRPDLLFSRQDVESEGIAEHAQKIAKFAWDTEVEADKRLYLNISKMLCYGTTGLQCQWGPTQGYSMGDFPIGPDGRPILDQQSAYQAADQGVLSGNPMQVQTLKSGRINWGVLSPFMLIPPPGVEEPELFPWLIVERATSIEYVKMRWPKAQKISAENLRVADARDIAIESSSDGSPVGNGILQDHVLVNYGYEMPSSDHPKGRIVIWCQDQILETAAELPYTLKGKPHHGIVFYRYHIVPGRFWGKGVVEDLIGPQRQRNRARSQMIEMKDRNLGRVYAQKGTITPANKPVGKIMELIEIPLHAQFPQETSGVPLGNWIQNEAQINDLDMDRIAGLGEVSQGQAPGSVDAYAAMALLAEQDERRIGPVLKDLRQQIGDNMLLTLELIKRYWPNNKRLAISGPDGVMDEFMFQRALLPAEFYMDVTRNAPLPTSPAAEAQKIFDIFNAATSAGQPLPVDWLKDSLDAGRALPFPKREDQVQQRKAEMEHYFLHAGQMIIPDPFDDDMLHLQIHRAERFNQMNVPGTEEYVNMLLEHEQLHVQNLAKKQPSFGGGGVPAQQGGHGIEAQNGDVASQAGLAQSASGAAPSG